MLQDTSSQKPSTHTGSARFLDACHLRKSDATPIWFMRQAGSCMSEYRKLLKRYDVLTIAKTPELSSQVALIPIRVLGVDAAVLYADIILPLEEMGVSLEIQPEIGPIIHHPLRSEQAIAALRIPDSEEITPFVMEGIRLIKRELAGRQAVIGIAGAPFTLACYLIEGRPSRDYRIAKTLMYGEPGLWHALMEKLTTVLANYLTAQVRAGADVIQLFDSWVGTLSPSAYQRFVQPYSQRVFEAVRQAGVPAIHFGTGTGALLETMAATGGDVLSVDWRVDLDEAWARIGYDHGIQGNLDPTLLLAPWPVIEEGIHDVLRRAANRPGHIFNLGHAVPMSVDEDVLRRVVDLVHSATQAAR